MMSGARQRWLGYGAAALATFGAMAWVDRRDDGPAVVEPVRRGAAGTSPTPPSASKNQQPADHAASIEALRQRAISAPLDDPFNTAALPSEAAAPVVAAPEARIAEAPAPAEAPPLPFTYVGRWSEGGRTTIFLLRNDKSVPVRGLGRIDDEYAVQAIDERGIVIQYVPLRQNQALRFDAPATAPSRSASVAATPAANDSSETQSEN